MAYYIFGIAQLLVWEASECCCCCCVWQLQPAAYGSRLSPALSSPLQTRRKDHAIMLTHHFVTLVLLVYSRALGFLKIGVCVT